MMCFLDGVKNQVISEEKKIKISERKVVQFLFLRRVFTEKSTKNKT
jgi:hypothetical protein